MGRGRALPSVPGERPFAAKASAPAPGASAQHFTGITSSAEQPAATVAATSAASAAAAQQASVNIGQQLLSQLQCQQTTPESGTKIGQQLLSQLQVQDSSRSASQAGPNAGQQLLMQLQGQAAVRAPAGAVLGQGLLQQLQSGHPCLCYHNTLQAGHCMHRQMQDRPCWRSFNDLWCCYNKLRTQWHNPWHNPWDIAIRVQTPLSSCSGELLLLKGLWHNPWQSQWHNLQPSGSTQAMVPHLHSTSCCSQQWPNSNAHNPHQALHSPPSPTQPQPQLLSQVWQDHLALH